MIGSLGLSLANEQRFSKMDDKEVEQLQEYVQKYNVGLNGPGAANSQTLGKDDFLKLLVTQLRYQDPLKPMEDKEFISQMAQFSSLEQIRNVGDTLEKMDKNLSMSRDRTTALSLLGKNVEIVANQNQKISGAVESINLRDALIKIEGVSYAIDGLTSVSVKSYEMTSAQILDEGSQKKEDISL